MRYPGAVRRGSNQRLKTPTWAATNGCSRFDCAPALLSVGAIDWIVCRTILNSRCSTPCRSWNRNAGMAIGILCARRETFENVFVDADEIVCRKNVVLIATNRGKMRMKGEQRRK